MDKKKIEKIGVLTSGGDSPGMNATLRAIVRAGIKAGLRVYGIRRGYEGLIKGDIYELGVRDVSEKLQAGGTFLMTARSEEFKTEAGRQKAVEKMHIYGLDALVVIGGDGSLRGAYELSESGINVVVIPGTIDNDMACTDYTIGYDTAMNTAVDAIDKIRDTSASHERCSVIEVMGRNAGYIALNVGMSTGAEVILIPEVPFNIKEDVFKPIIEGRNIGKHHYIVCMAEGCGDANEMAKKIEEATDIKTRASVLGYIQRGGSPSVRDRTMACGMGMLAVDVLLEGKENRVIIWKDGKIRDISVSEAISAKKSIKPHAIEEANRLF